VSNAVRINVISRFVKQLSVYPAGPKYSEPRNVFDTTYSSFILFLVKSWHLISLKMNGNVRGAQVLLQQCRMATRAPMLMPSPHQGSETKRNQ
jgi:hypothetical protein